MQATHSPSYTFLFLSPDTILQNSYVFIFKGIFLVVAFYDFRLERVKCSGLSGILIFYKFSFNTVKEVHLTVFVFV